jgi:hypothetical protein
MEVLLTTDVLKMLIALKEGTEAWSESMHRSAETRRASRVR